MPKGARVLIRWLTQTTRTMNVIAMDEGEATGLFHAFCHVACQLQKNLDIDERSRTVFFQNGSTLQFIRDNQE